VLDNSLQQFRKEKVQAALQMDKYFEGWIGDFFPEEALDYVQNCEADYNRVTREGLIELVKKCTNMGNNVWFRIGIESSLVIYVHFSRFPESNKTPKNWTKMIEKCQELGQVATADEFTVHQNDVRELSIRFWWD
jgi:hypothetical protein